MSRLFCRDFDHLSELLFIKRSQSGIGRWMLTAIQKASFLVLKQYFAKQVSRKCFNSTFVENADFFVALSAFFSNYNVQKLTEKKT